MKILFISQYYPPEIGAASNRIGFFAEYMAHKGHAVTVLTSAPNYPGGKIYPGYGNRFSSEREKGVTLVRTKIFLTRKSNAITRMLHYLSFFFGSFIAGALITRPDVIIATSPPLFVGMAGVFFKKIWRRPFILDIRDLWPESVESVGAVKNRRILKQAEKLARWIYRNADRICCTSPGIQKHLPPAAQNKTSIMPNGADLSLFSGDISGDGVRRRWNIQRKFVALYTGNIGLAQKPEVFIGAAEALKDDEEIVFLIVGAGVLLADLERSAREKKLTNIIFAGLEPRARMPEFVAAADVCIIPYKAADTFRNTLPSKMFDYMAGGKPVIINLRGEASELLFRANAGILAEEEDPVSLARCIVELKNHPREAQKLGGAGKEFVEKFYRREAVAEQYEKVIMAAWKPT
ncbi:glycosyltransferase family 4 protein [Candidatus Peregrinibacteria bacterium]|nr:glycosyltransferase family 4 protein [Candidatus Peregrinibacteria bacterium]